MNGVRKRLMTLSNPDNYKKIRANTKLSPHFIISEIMCKDPVLTNKPVIAKLPPPELFTNFTDTLIFLEALRLKVGLPIRLTSVYRDLTWNFKVGGARLSAHKTFHAGDIDNPYNSFNDYSKFYDECEEVAEYCEQVHGCFIRLGKYLNQGFVHVDSDRSKFSKRWEK